MTINTSEIKKYFPYYNGENTTDQIVYGFRTQINFGLLLKNLKLVQEIVLIDTGSCGFPDYKIVTKEGKTIFIEVKNSNSEISSVQKIVHKCVYLETLGRYAKLNGGQFLIAHYWNKCNIWTLNEIMDFEKSGTKYQITMLTAIKYNKMGLIGDYYIGVKEGNLRLELEVIDDVVFDPKLYVGDLKMETIQENALAFFLFKFCDWEQVISQTKDKTKEIIVIKKFKKSSIRQGFSIIGPISSIFTNQVKQSTLDNEGRVDALFPKYAITELHTLEIDPKIHKNLPIWIFQQIGRSKVGT